MATPRIIFAHSFGGKVALQFLANRFDRGVPLPLHTWILDSLPGPYSIDADKRRTGSNSVVRVIELVSKLPKTFASKEGMIAQLQLQGVDKGVALWLATNIVPDGQGGFAWGFDMGVVEALFLDFCGKDLWPFLRRFAAADTGNAGGATIHFLRAGRNKMWTDDILAQFEHLQKTSSRLDGSGTIQLHTMPDVGHWLHAENLHGMFDIISENGA